LQGLLIKGENSKGALKILGLSDREIEIERNFNILRVPDRKYIIFCLKLHHFSQRASPPLPFKRIECEAHKTYID
jgi:hypothetical protein